MSSPDVTDETTVNDSHSVTVPSKIRERLDIEPGDKLRWTLGKDGVLRVEVIRRGTVPWPTSNRSTWERRPTR